MADEFHANLIKEWHTHHIIHSDNPGANKEASAADECLHCTKSEESTGKSGFTVSTMAQLQKICTQQLVVVRCMRERVGVHRRPYARYHTRIING